jgi:hypothetical protein
MRWTSAFGALFKSMLIGVPVVVLLFLLFPRLENPLWRTPNLEGPKRAVSGVSDEASINNISPLSLSDEVVMQVQFSGERPPGQLLYWRGPVLSVIENGVWRTSELEKSLRSKAWSVELIDPASAQEKTFNYQVIVDTTKHNWLFPLEPLSSPLNANAELEYSRDGQVLPTQKRLIRYDAQLSVFQSGAQWITPAWRHTPQLSPQERALYSSLPYANEMNRWLSTQTQLLSTLALNDVMDNVRWNVIESQLKNQTSELPLGLNPRTQLLGRWLQLQQIDSLHKVQLALSVLMENGTFMYSLSPTQLGAQANDDFLFNTRQGFCQHFALSFGLLMRAAGVPTRLVNGYLGGEINTLNNLWMLREKQAHIWAEVWLEQADGTGAWQRIDPTALLARGSFEMGQQQISQSVGSGGDGMSLSKLMPKQLLLWTGNAWAAAENQWNQWVLTYDSDRQEGWVKRLGKRLGKSLGLDQFLGGGRLEVLIYLMVGLLLLFVLGMAILLYRAGRVVISPLDRGMAKLEQAYLNYLVRKQPKTLRSKQLEILGRQPSETYRAWLTRLGVEHPTAHDKALWRLMKQFEQLKYAPAKAQKIVFKEWQKQLENAVKQLKKEISR